MQTIENELNNMNIYKHTGIFCTLILVLTFIIIGPLMELLTIPKELAEYFNIHYYFVMSMFGIVIDYA